MRCNSRDIFSSRRKIFSPLLASFLLGQHGNRLVFRIVFALLAGGTCLLIFLGRLCPVTIVRICEIFFSSWKKISIMACDIFSSINLNCISLRTRKVARCYNFMRLQGCSYHGLQSMLLSRSYPTQTVDVDLQRSLEISRDPGYP